MKNHLLGNALILLATLLINVSYVSAQVVTKASRPILFAVLNDGMTLEPIALIGKAKLEPTVNGSDALELKTAFGKTYFRKGTLYKLVFGGANTGTVTVKSADPKSDCSSNMAAATTKASKVLLKGMVMGLATNAAVKPMTSFRRKPSGAEKVEIETLVRAEFAKQKLTPDLLRYHNLTALDVNNDGKAELVGSYWVEIDKLTRGLLFFIAGKSSNGTYALGYNEYRSVDQAKVMNGDIKAVDDGVYHELLLDTFDYDGDGSGEIFTHIRSFEGSGFNSYRLNGNRWIKFFEGSNYHCGY